MAPAAAALGSILRGPEEETSIQLTNNTIQYIHYDTILYRTTIYTTIHRTCTTITKYAPAAGLRPSSHLGGPPERERGEV